MSEETPERVEQEQEKKHEPAVAALLGSDRVVLNIGSVNHVRVGQRWLIYELSDFEVTDPTTGESLGRVEIPKGTGKIVGVQERMSVLESDQEPPETSPTGLASSTIGFGELMNPARKAPFRNATEGDRVKRLSMW